MSVFRRPLPLACSSISLFTAAIITVWVLACTFLAPPAEARFYPQMKTLRGTVEGNGSALPGFQVMLYASDALGWSNGRVLGTATTDDDGEFEIRYKFLPWVAQALHPVIFVIAEGGQVSLASVIGVGDEVPDKVMVNERTTVAAGVAFAQFIKDDGIRGNRYGMINAVRMAANLADPETGNAGEVISKKPNGTDTHTYPTFNSMANVVSSCVANPANCSTLLAQTSPAGDPPTASVMQAIANMTKYPSQNLDALFALSFINPVYQPALADEEKPASWLLFLKFTGGFYSFQDENNLLNGPGNLAIDRKGYAWVNDNYAPQRVEDYACAGQRLLKFYPWGEPFPGVPYFGGGLSGAGFGITLDPRGAVWVGNFGFEAPACADMLEPDQANKIPATHNSVSLFRPDGVPVSRNKGFTKGNIFWPQATVSDPKGNIWVANCGNDTVTLIPRGNPSKARNFPLEPHAFLGDGASPEIKPFGIAIDPEGRAWVTGNKAGEVFRIRPNGLVESVDSLDLLSWPLGISGDSKGNMWVSNSDAVNVPCVDPLDTQPGGNPSVVMFPADGGIPMQFQGGGLSIPWGNAVDGDDTLWVFNFGHTPFEIGVEDEWPETGLSRFCGTGKCPDGLDVGDPISPDSGYTSNALERITAGNVDPSGNLWLMNNWKKIAPVVYDTNPGGNSIVIVPGAAAPIKTPLIGPPRSFDKPWRRPWYPRKF